jgi:hypothetical protein
MSKQFKIINLKSSLFWNNDINRASAEPTLYDDGERAAMLAANLTRNTGQKWQVRPHITDTKWRERETKRFYTGEYFPVPWETQHWWRGSYEDKNHFAHVSVEKDTRIAYTHDDEQGVADKQRRVRPGVYLTEFFSSRINNDVIKFWAAQFSVLYETITVKFAYKADEIEEVYKKGPRSCMDGIHAAAGNFADAGMHPCRVYEGPDLAIAYLEKEKDDTRMVCSGCQELPAGCPNAPNYCRGATEVGKYAARCLVWPEKKLYGRAYGDTDRLKLALEREGYKHQQDLVGARLTRIPAIAKTKASLLSVGEPPRPAKIPGFVVPYIDGKYHKLRDDGKYLIIDPMGYINGESANGTGADTRPRCEECNQLVDPNTLRRIYDRECDRRNVCNTCVGKEPLYQCFESGYYAYRKDMVLFPSGRAVHIAYLDSVMDVCSATHTPIIYHTDEYSNMADGTKVHRWWYDENKVECCDYCGYGCSKTCNQAENCRSQHNKEWVLTDDLMVYHRSQISPASNARYTAMTYAEANAAYRVKRDERRRKEAEEYAQQKAEEVARRRREAQRARRARERAAAQRSTDGVPL